MGFCVYSEYVSGHLYGTCSVVGHFSPLKEDNTVVKAGDLLKM